MNDNSKVSYGMYSDEGDNAVHEIVRNTAKILRTGLLEVANTYPEVWDTAVLDRIMDLMLDMVEVPDIFDC